MDMPLLVATFDLDEKARAAVAAELGGRAGTVYLAGVDDRSRREALADATVLLARAPDQLRLGEPELIRSARLVPFLSAGVDFIPLPRLAGGRAPARRRQLPAGARRLATAPPGRRRRARRIAPLIGPGRLAPLGGHASRAAVR